jgi:ParB family chromosome partitioning protein
MTHKHGLGKGLDALIPGGEVERAPSSGARLIPVGDIQRNPRQPRTHFDAGELQELAASIRQHGVLQPLLVMPLPQGGYQLVAGERRLEASRLAGLASVPAVVRSVTPQEQLELALIENLQRTDLNPLEAAEGYRQLAQDFGLSHEAIAERVGKSRAAVSNTLRLLKLPPACRQALIDGVISEGHARALLALPTAEAQPARPVRAAHAGGKGLGRAAHAGAGDARQSALGAQGRQPGDSLLLRRGTRGADRALCRLGERLTCATWWSGPAR